MEISNRGRNTSLGNFQLDLFHLTKTRNFNIPNAPSAVTKRLTLNRKLASTILRSRIAQYMESSFGPELPSKTTCFGILPRVAPSKSSMRFKCVCKFWSSLTRGPSSGSGDQHKEIAGPELPSQIINFEILPRLPTKSLMRFRCVCKSWSSLIRDPSFVNAHHNLGGCKKHTHLLFTAWDKSAMQQHFFSLQLDQEGSLMPAVHLLNIQTPADNDELLHYAQSINGLVCIYFDNISFPNQTDPENPLLLFNPCTGESITLPLASTLSPTTPYVTHHFGFNPITNEYKVLQVQKFIPAMRGMQLMVKIFKLGTSFWRRIEVDLNDLPFDPVKCPFHRRSVCVHGAIHWMHGKENVIVVFDIGDEKFKVIPMPADYTCFTHFVTFPVGCIAEVDGCVALIGDKRLMRHQAIGLWILRDYENQVWVKETVIIPPQRPESEYPVPFCTIHTGELLLPFSRSSRQDFPHVRAYLYNMQSEIFRESEIRLPREWTFLNGSQIKFLTCYEDSIQPLS